jgi:hypothetical protein
MDCREFVVKIKQYAVDETVESMSSQLAAPQLMLVESDKSIKARNRRLEREASWFATLTPTDQATFHAILQDCAERTLSQAFRFLDGAGGDSDGVFEVVECADGQPKNVLNPQNSDKLHDLLSDVCQRSRRAE